MGDDLLSRTEHRRIQALSGLDADTQARLGQFFTPTRASSLVAGLPRLPQSGRLRVLDPGAGVGSLAAALVARIITEAPELDVEIVAVEVDPQIAPLLEETMTDCELTARQRGVRVCTRVVIGDFVEMGSLLTGGPTFDGTFDIVIMNPPYAKLGARSSHRRVLSARGVDCPNLYAAFMALGIQALDIEGQLVAITPRSFANGPYFSRFREYVLDHLAIDRLHTFESRSAVFADSGVLQENIVLCGTRGGVRHSVLLSVSRDHTDSASSIRVDYSAVVRPADPHRLLRITASSRSSTATALVESMPASLADLGITASTGRVVDFRSRGNLRAQPDNESVPLVYPGNIRGGVIEWPRDIRKPQGFAILHEADRRLLLPTGCYVVVKRFSAKEERRRVTAAVWDSEVFGGRAVAFENHLNVLHADGAGVDRALAIGLTYWLNSSTVDDYFRTFSGHTQVNASDLRSLRFPTLDALLAIGTERRPAIPTQSEVDDMFRGLTASARGAA